MRIYYLKTGFNRIIKGYWYTKGFVDYFKLPTKHSFGWNQINNKIDKQLNFNLIFLHMVDFFWGEIYSIFINLVNFE